ncbi:MAG: Holliday junction resolvase RuvX [Candidatus Margulisiibacteriota bacterium]|nr:MAG: Holliday junction DNA helicase RuvA [Candidatus Margulisbacteria bacterium GWD2_39_127]OGI05445.1 MAG: Holliday junction DNA helicase RuvA [Candidatus Margulisbacteria bacterium GWF2_38_17]OGI07817.1 MAG: Holliday junction DNA helicase RuvA [Candidatus Margulisbacteria bacterium GWE2_39_32]PZM80127.1 MAG: Holliday junction resolvase RuvX [Candidatus Margulisiibacteriota bacterium]HAR62607.1 Holliday junction resolvase RuvX [Candidatus Margulisiibacteriota bacterium]
MNRLLGIDYGEKRIGVALSDPLQIIASPFKVVANDNKAISEIKEIIKEYDVSEIVVGRPINLKGAETASTIKAREFKEKLEQEISLPIAFWDERLSTKSANNALLEGNVSRGKRKQLVDKIAAVFILQSYMDCRKRK